MRPKVGSWRTCGSSAWVDAASPGNGGRGAEAVYRCGRLTASYVHFYFPSNPSALAALLAP